MEVEIGGLAHESTSAYGLRGKRASRQLTFLWGVGASVGVSVGFTPFVPTHPRDEGMVNETRGFIRAKDLLREGKESETDFGCKILFVGAKVGCGDGMNGDSLQ